MEALRRYDETFKGNGEALKSNEYAFRVTNKLKGNVMFFNCNKEMSYKDA